MADREPKLPTLKTASEVVEHCKQHALVLAANPQRQVRVGDARGGDDGRYIGLDFVRAQRADEREEEVCLPNLAIIDGDPSQRVWVRYELWEELTKQIQDDGSEIRRVSTWPVDRTFVYFDISEYSELPQSHQLLAMNQLSRLIHDDKYWRVGPSIDARAGFDAVLPQGDGFIVVLKNPTDGAFSAAHIAALIEFFMARGRLDVDIHFRVGVHTGQVNCFWERGIRDSGRWNYVGDGINGGARVLQVIGRGLDDVVYLSHESMMRVHAASEESNTAQVILGHLANKGRFADKTGRKWRVYQMNHGAVVHELIGLWQLGID